MGRSYQFYFVLFSKHLTDNWDSKMYLYFNLLIKIFNINLKKKLIMLWQRCSRLVSRCIDRDQPAGNRMRFLTHFSIFHIHTPPPPPPTSSYIIIMCWWIHNIYPHNTYTYIAYINYNSTRGRRHPKHRHNKNIQHILLLLQRFQF